MSVLTASQVSKVYQRFPTELHRMAHRLGAGAAPTETFHALADVNVRVAAGECVGLIGRNGAGKSTLLKICAGVLAPSSGAVERPERSAAILELGLGFDFELTGRENVMRAAAMMGLAHQQIVDRVEAIRDFTEIGEAFDRPMRTYSTGMKMRVAFSVVTAWQPDVLFIDEALSVGDAYFQHKSFDRLLSLKAQGCGLIFVSHDQNAIKTLSDRVLLLDEGRIIQDGPAEQVCDFYNALIGSDSAATVDVLRTEDGRTKTQSGSLEAQFTEVSIRNPEGQIAQSFEVGQSLFLHARVELASDVDSLVVGFSIRDRLGRVVFGTNTWHTDQVIVNAKALQSYEIAIGLAANFGVGDYSVQVALVDRDTHLTANYQWIDGAALFSVTNLRQPYFEGVSWQKPTIEIKEI